MRDEDYAYEQWRQAKIDALTEEEFRYLGIGQTKIGSALKDSEKVQRFANRDPWPGVPFVDPERHNNLTRGEWLLYLGLIFAMIVALLLWEYVA